VPDLLIEIGCEDLPAVACREAERQIPGLLADALDRAGLDANTVGVHVSPRRIAAIATGLPAERPAKRQQVRGPKSDAPEQARAGFARKHGLEAGDLVERDGLLWAISEGAATAVDELVPEVVSGMVAALNFSKSMRWDHGRFSRPVRWLVVKLDHRVVPVELFGLTATGTSRGHRFLAAAVDIGDAASYRADLRGGYVIVDSLERRGLIEAGLNDAGGWVDPLRKLDEVVYLAEWPSVLTGRIDQRFLDLPERVVITAMQSHQRYFPLRAEGRLEPRFLFVANGGDPETVIRGNEEVLVGRLTDAEFAFASDIERGIEAMAAELDRVSFLEGSGSIADKTLRVRELVQQLCARLELGPETTKAAVRAAELSKADLVSSLVGEFSDLEGYAGGVYARRAGVDEVAAAAIEEHHLPYGFAGALPASDAGAVLSIADKADTLGVAFKLGLQPTGSRDPYGLRRAAAGLVAVALDRGWRLGLPDLVGADAVAFVLDRVEAAMLERGVTREEVRAARGSGESEPVAVGAMAVALHESAGPQRDALRDAYGRSRRIAGDAHPAIEPERLTGPAQIELHEALLAVDAAISGAGTTAAEALRAAGDLVAPVSRFFDEVLVMDPDPDVQRTNLGLVAMVAACLRRLGDFDELPG
jgi:glycyl-tRNA synthetase beta chain